MKVSDVAKKAQKGSPAEVTMFHVAKKGLDRIERESKCRGPTFVMKLRF